MKAHLLISLFSIFFSITSVQSLLCKQKKIKLYAIYTPSHAILKDNYFLPSIQDDFELVIEFHEQTCPTAGFLSQGWKQTTIRKVELIIRAIKENPGDIFIFSDVDIQFFAPVQDILMKLMKGKDLIIQKNCPNGVLCSGFFACRANEKTLRLWKDVKKEMQTRPDCSDQKSLNSCIKRHSAHNPYGIVWAYLPASFFGAGTLTGQYWKPGKKLPVPHDIVLHHANWTNGIKNKMLQLEYVRDIVESRSAH